jgi:hypothetical protein
MTDPPTDKASYNAPYIILDNLSLVHIPTKYFPQINVNIIFSFYSQH